MILPLHFGLDLTHSVDHFRLDDNLFDPYFVSSKKEISIPESSDFSELVADLQSGVQGRVF